MLGIALVLSGCYPSGSPPYGLKPNYIDFVRVNGIEYVAALMFTPGRALTDSDLGPEQFRVKQTIAGGGFAPDYNPVDGDAAFIPSGDPVYSVRGYSASFRLAARHDGKLRLYEADKNPKAKLGADLLDIGGKVKGIALLDRRDWQTVLARLEERSRIDALVRLVLDAPVDQSPRTGARISADNPVMLSFQLDDGTASLQGYDRVDGVLGRGIQVAGLFQTTVNELVLSVPTPSPVPGVVNLTRNYDLAHATYVTPKAQSPTITFVRDAFVVAVVAAALDADLPAHGATQPDLKTMVTFTFTDHIVALMYDAATETLTVVQPDHGLAVHAPPRFVELLRPR